MSSRGEELARRTSGEVEISLRWSRDEDRLVVVVDDPVTEEVFELNARRDNALDVYYHPYAYMAAPRAA
jgi:hypothetical protein